LPPVPGSRTVTRDEDRSDERLPLATQLQSARRGLTIFITGLPASGKSTLAGALREYLCGRGLDDVVVLDGDVIRNHASPRIGFSKSDRDRHVLSVGTLAVEATAAGGIAICALVAPYDSIRKRVRRQVASSGSFILVYLNTPLDVCEQRDPKGLYKQARAGLLPLMTGVDDPYEEPRDADVTIDTSVVGVGEALEMIAGHLERHAYLNG
jgi:sulfate adenylyltransferase